MDVNVKSNTFFVLCHRGAAASFGGLNGNDEHYLAYADLNILHSAGLKTSGHCRNFILKDDHSLQFFEPQYIKLRILHHFVLTFKSLSIHLF